MSSTRKTSPGGDAGGAVLLILVLAGLGLYAAVWGVMSLSHQLDGTGADVPVNPIEFVAALTAGSLAWAPSALMLGIAATVLVAVVVIDGAFLIGRARGKRSRVDVAARHMGRGRDVEGLTKQNAVAIAKRLGVDAAPGVVVGKSVATGATLYGSWEDLHVVIAGPRTGKTTSLVTPAVVEAPGAVVTTSNKRDVVDATRDVRAKRGQVWVFDPQGVAEEPATWWWDPLSYVTDDEKARTLATHFATGSRDASAKTDAYFDGAGLVLLAGLLLAAAVDRRPITDVYRWLTRPTDETAADVLRERYPVISDQLLGAMQSPEKQRGGIYGTAQQMAACLTNSRILPWVTPPEGADKWTRQAFDPHAFVQHTDTVYALSKEGAGNAGLLVTALTVAVIEAAEDLAKRSPNGRLVTPMLGVLDEAANVCRWRDLPSLYSHYGSRGIILMTVLQSWSQGVDVWTESGMKKLWSAANIATYLGGVKETGFLEDLSKLVGSYDRVTSSVTSGQRTSVSRSLQRDRILDVDELSALPRGRAVVLASGSRATLVRSLPWMAGQHADAIRASIQAHDPHSASTLEDAYVSLASMQAADREQQEAA
ncbi:hypothetical protein GCM10009846_01360 [Agrococcus versicolor]|uniref:TraD/TraG TraM recognition site domain-containing protein n=1 Tax=Agrococcus versicolor TaxID=501482 RepID=A0ABN3AIR1_9MICO